MRLDAAGMHYRELNEKIRDAVQSGRSEIELVNINGQRYIGTGITQPAKITIHGTPGNDLGAFMDGPELVVHGNGQDGIGNTMNSGRIVINGRAGDLIGYAMRGGRIIIGGDVGYRVGIHMKSFKKQVPVVVVGGKAADFFGEYMAGGILVLLGIGSQPGEAIAGDYLGTGMHGGVIYVRGEVDPDRLGKEVSVAELTDEDYSVLEEILEDFRARLGLSEAEVSGPAFSKLVPTSHRPYGNLYAY